MAKQPELPTFWDFGVEVENGQTIHMGKDAPSLDALLQQYRLLRGNLIAHTINIECALDSLLVDLIDPLKSRKISNAGPDVKNAVDELKLIIDASWLKSRDTNMRLKIDMLQKTSKFHPLLENEDVNELAKWLHEVHNIRNDFAHRMMVVKQKKTEKGYGWDVYLDFGDRKTLLDAEYVKKINDVYAKASRRLEELEKKLA
jgi:hypothetical protein